MIHCKTVCQSLLSLFLVTLNGQNAYPQTVGKPTARQSVQSFGLSPDELARRFKHPDTGAFEMTKFLKNTNTGELQCSIRGVDNSTKVSLAVNDDDATINSVTLLWNPPIENASEAQIRNSTMQFFVTVGLLSQSIDSTMNKEELNRLLSALHLAGGSSANLFSNCQFVTHGNIYRTRWTDHKLALTIQPEAAKRPAVNPNPRFNEQSLDHSAQAPKSPDDIALQSSLNKLDSLSLLNFPDAQDYDVERYHLMIAIARLYEKRDDLGRALDYYNMVNSNLHLNELDEKFRELVMKIQANPKLNHPNNRNQIIDHRYH
ncbi:hypothetical protein BH10CYA1_BH10CYA1_58510 [soil metagenome]